MLDAWLRDVRIALGAQARAVVTGVMRDAMAMVGLGIAAGVSGALYLSRFVETLLFGVTPHDPATRPAWSRRSASCR